MKMKVRKIEINVPLYQLNGEMGLNIRIKIKIKIKLKSKLKLNEN